MTTGLHTVADIYCNKCLQIVGWKYVSDPPLLVAATPLTPQNSSFLLFYSRVRAGRMRVFLLLLLLLLFSTHSLHL